MGKSRMLYTTAKKIADTVVELLSPHCERIGLPYCEPKNRHL